MNARQGWNPRDYARNARFVSDLGMPVLEWLNPKANERILDLGCGDGALLAELAERGCSVVGVDSSPEFINTVKAQTLEAYLMDGERLQFEQEFDAVFSNAALHWMKKSAAVIRGVWKALVPGGRFVGEMGGQGNIQTIVTALYQALEQRGIDPYSLNPWYFPAAEEYRYQLESMGFQVKRIVLFERPTPLPTDMRGWLMTFGASFTASLPKAEQPAFINEVCAALQAKLHHGNGQWIADYMRLRFEAYKP
ncbi:class I SAM-dependent methyltransferase [Nitrosococcus watsonii]|uniref:Methyltransferase type 11 n=1 Tax=Nitrosococcus watsoni (strain C-113) TaxID=105559 RepID=D8K5A7_NITWC|nr:class I SAM-dependent methyltransferase [Nitrosococcus watsonii]ADJ28084.1 Methyltransferase type 11 [Nitrosococcus watsonii C-113]